MKIGTTAAFATIAAAAIAAAIYWQRPAKHPQATPSVAPLSEVTEPLVPRAPAPSAGTGVGATDTLALEELTRLTIRSLSSDDVEVAEHAITQLLPALARHDIVAAARVADLFVDSPYRPRILSVIARAWTEQNHLHALEWSQSLPDVTERETVMVGILALVSQSDPGEAVRLRQQYSQDPDDDAALTDLAQRWAESDLSAVLGWTDSLPPGPQRDQLMARAAFIQSQSSPAEAAQLVMDRIPPGEARGEALVSIVHQWARQDFAAASAWVARMPDALLRERAMQELEAAARAQR
jgi:hypothetical protein